MRWRISLLTLIALFVAVSCDQQPVEPLETPVAESPAFDFMNGPEHTGMVWRFMDQRIQFWDFEETPGDPWLVVFGLPEGDVLLDCEGPGTSEPRHIHEVWFDETYRSIINMTRKNATVRAFDAAEFWGTWDSEGFCAAFALEPVAEGEADQHFNDNDSWGTRAHNVWSERANGKVNYNGKRYKLHLNIHWMWNESREEMFTERFVAWIK